MHLYMGNNNNLIRNVPQNIELLLKDLGIHVVTKSVDLEKIKARANELSVSWKKKFGHLSESVSRSGMDGVQHWLKSHHQVEELEEALEELRKSSSEPDFQLLQVHTTLSSFVLPEEDIGQAEWYLTAHQLLESLEHQLEKEQRVDAKKLQSILKELKFISEADEFHTRYQLSNIQQEVKTLYQSLQSSLSEFKSLELKRRDADKEQEKIKLAELETQKAEALAKKAMLDSVKMKEKRLAIAEEKKRKLAEAEAIDAKRKQEEEEANNRAKQAEADRQSKLQDAYVDLQLEEKISSWALTEHIQKLQQKMKTSQLTEEEKETLSAFIEFAKEKM